MIYLLEPSYTICQREDRKIKTSASPFSTTRIFINKLHLNPDCSATITGDNLFSLIRKLNSGWLFTEVMVYRMQRKNTSELINSPCGLHHIMIYGVQVAGWEIPLSKKTFQQNMLKICVWRLVEFEMRIKLHKDSRVKVCVCGLFNRNAVINRRTERDFTLSCLLSFLSLFHIYFIKL